MTFDLIFINYFFIKLSVFSKIKFFYSYFFLLGCLVFGETIAAALGSDASNYFHKCWNHAAAHILSPPLRSDPTTSSHLIHLLARLVHSFISLICSCINMHIIKVISQYFTCIYFVQICKLCSIFL